MITASEFIAESIEYIALVHGLMMWYVVSFCENAINGAEPSFWMPFRCLIEDISFNTPGGWKRRLRHARGDADLAAAYPGLKHLLFMHILFPLAPWLLAKILIS